MAIKQLHAFEPSHKPMTNARFTKSQRLLAKPQFDEVMDRGSKIVCTHFVLVTRVTTKADSLPRLGLIVSKKVGNSVVRNKVKRTIREQFRQSEGAQVNLRGRSIVVIARANLKGPNGKPIKNIGRSFSQCLSRLQSTLKPLKKGAL
jgi:ribonuclease P protein component